MTVVKIVLVVTVGMISLIWANPQNLAAQQRRQAACIVNANGNIVITNRCNRRRQTRLTRASFEAPHNELSTRVDANESAISAVQASLNSASEERNQIQEELNKLGDDVTELASSVSDTKDLAEQNEGFIHQLDAALQNAQQSTQQSISTLTQNINNVSNTLALQVADIEANSNAIAELQPSAVYHVAASGAPYTTIQQAVNQANADGVDENSPAVILLSPGTYTIAQTISLVSGLTIQGVNPSNTIIESDGGLAFIMASNSHLKNLTIHRSGGGGNAAIHAGAITGFTLDNVVLEVIDGPASAVVTLFEPGDVYFNNVRLISDRPLEATSIQGLSMSGDAEVRLHNVQIRLRATGSARGIVTSNIQGNDVINVIVTDSRIDTFSEDSSSTGLSVGTAGRFEFHNSTLLVESNSAVFGAAAVFQNNDDSQLTILNSSVRCTENTAPLFGCINSQGGLVEVSHSRVELIDSATRRLIYTQGAATVRALHSQLLGGNLAGNGTATCAAITDENYDFLPDLCVAP